MRPVTAASLELDLEVFSGPFDLLLTLVLREEIDLLEVQLAEIVIAYLDHLEARGELDLEVATEFLVLIAALLELKSRLMLPREDDELADFEPGEAAEELLARMLEAQRYRRAAEHLAARLAGEEGCATAARRCRRRCAARTSPRPAPSTTRAGWAPRSAGCCACRRAVLGHLTVPRVTTAERLDAPARPAAPRRHDVRRGRPRRRPGDRRRDAVRAARALQAGRGHVEPGRAVRRDRDRARRRAARAGLGGRSA